MAPAPVTAIITAYQRREATAHTLKTIASCVPPPAEIIVHVDGGGSVLADLVRAQHPAARVLVSKGHVGPGGARNLMVNAATQPFIASFDDDSYPMDADFFQRVADLFEAFQDAWVIAGKIFHLHQTIAPPLAEGAWAADFSGGGCAYRRERYLEVGGYVPLPAAYNMEEVDFALRLHAKQGRILGTPWLRVFHDTDLARHSDPEVTSASIANLALLAFLRYPLHLWSIGAAQVLNRIQWLARNGRRRGILGGLAAIPAHVWRHRRLRHPLDAPVVRSYLALRRHPIPAPVDRAVAGVHG